MVAGLSRHAERGHRRPAKPPSRAASLPDRRALPSTQGRTNRFVLRSRLCRYGGLALTLLCVGYFLNRLGRLPTHQLAAMPFDLLAMSLLVASLVHLTLLVVLAVGYGELLLATGHGPVRMREAVAVWGRANLAKYLPGNVFHLAGRQALGGHFGWPQTKTAAATVLELALHVLVPCLIVVCALLLTDALATARRLAWLLPVLLGASLVLLLSGLGHLLPRWCPKPLRQLVDRCALSDLQALLRAALLQAVFLIGMGLMAWFLYSLIERGIKADTFPSVLAIMVGSWLVGLITPGAPGGLGVRETTMLLLGAPFLDYGALVMLALLMRAAALFGEGLLFLLACTIPLTPANCVILHSHTRRSWRR
jgi:hypothetical protein